MSEKTPLNRVVALVSEHFGHRGPPRAQIFAQKILQLLPQCHSVACRYDDSPPRLKITVGNELIDYPIWSSFVVRQMCIAFATVYPPSEDFKPPLYGGTRDIIVPETQGCGFVARIEFSNNCGWLNQWFKLDYLDASSTISSRQVC